MPSANQLARMPSGLTVETVLGIDDVASIAAEWRVLEQQQTGAVFFQSYDWCLYLWRTRAAVASSTSVEHRVLVVRDEGCVVAIWPLAIRTGASGRFAQDLGEPFGQYSDILIARDCDASAVLDIAFAELSRWRIDGLVLRKVRADSPLCARLERVGTAIGTIEHAPAISLGEPGGHGAYRLSLTAKTRKNLRNYRNRLGREGRVVHEVITAPAESAGAIERCFDGRTAWLAASGLSSTAFADPAFTAVVDGLTHGSRGAPDVIAMRLGLEPSACAPAVDLSLHWGFEHQGRYYAFMAWKNPAYDDFSPGRLHLEDVVTTAAQRAIATVDLLVPAMPYKTSVANATVEVRAYGVPLTARGRLVIKGWHGLLRPRLKVALLAMSPAARRALFDGPRVLRAKLGQWIGHRLGKPSSPLVKADIS